MIAGSVFEILRTPWLKLPSASKIPARNPLDHSAVATAGHATSARTRSTFDVALVRIACMTLRPSASRLEDKPPRFVLTVLQILL